MRLRFPRHHRRPGGWAWAGRRRRRPVRGLHGRVGGEVCVCVYEWASNFWSRHAKTWCHRRAGANLASHARALHDQGLAPSLGRRGEGVKAIAGGAASTSARRAGDETPACLVASGASPARRAVGSAPVKERGHASHRAGRKARTRRPRCAQSRQPVLPPPARFSGQGSPGGQGAGASCARSHKTSRRGSAIGGRLLAK